MSRTSRLFAIAAIACVAAAGAFVSAAVASRDYVVAAVHRAWDFVLDGFRVSAEVQRIGPSQDKPRVRLVPGRVYLATTAQIYPHVTSWNGSCGLAEEVAAAALADTPALESPPRWQPSVASA